MATMTNDTDVIVLDANAKASELKTGEKYLAQVNNIEDFGVFVSLTPGRPDGTDVSGLVHESNLPPLAQPHEFEVGDRCVVEVEKFKDDGDLAFVMEYAEDVGAGGNGDIPNVDIIDVERRSNGSTSSRAPRRAPRDEQVEELKEEVATLREAVEAVTGDGDEFADPALDAVKSINKLRRSGNSVESYEKEVTDGGDAVRVAVVFDRADQ